MNLQKNNSNVKAISRKNINFPKDSSINIKKFEKIKKN